MVLQRVVCVKEFCTLGAGEAEFTVDFLMLKKFILKAQWLCNVQMTVRLRVVGLSPFCECIPFCGTLSHKACSQKSFRACVSPSGGASCLDEQKIPHTARTCNYCHEY